MIAKEPIIIPTKKSSILLGVLISAIFIGIGIVMLNTDATRRYSSTFLHTVGFFGTAFFGLGFLYFFKRLFENKPGLILDETGLWNNSSIISSHTIKWSELRGVRLRTIGKEKILLLNFKDKESFIKKFNLFERFLFRINMSMSNAPFAISTRTLKCDVEELRRKVKGWGCRGGVTEGFWLC
jgi:hypothetical protein